MSKIEMTEDDLKEFKKLYEEAVEKGLETFKFQERAVVTSYAKYLIEFFEGE